ncbi:MerR family transcriptional regulator [Streptomyces sp. NPDC006660]|uniref:MerR family transcriptional regulator n=1 Tax=Streptomyces sp. NPDC006660 TaxID=3156901 RepID=UPI0034081655
MLPLESTDAETVNTRDTQGRSTQRYLRIGEAADATGVNERLLRYYESRGLLTPRRTDMGHRLYAQEDVSRVRLIRFLLDGGVSTQNISVLIDCAHNGIDISGMCGELAAVLDDEFERISHEIESLSQAREYIAVLTGRTVSRA